MSAPIEGISVREFARRDGCDDKLVRNAINRGKLPTLDGGKLDPALVGTGWRRQNRKALGGADIGADKPAKSAPAPPKRKAENYVRDRDLEAALSAAELGDEDFIASVLAGQFRVQFAAEQIKENALAAKHLLAVRKEAGDLVDLEVAEAILFETARATRDAWLNWPARTAPLVAAELGIAVEPLLEALNKHVQQQLQDIGEPDPDFTPAGQE